MSGAEMLLIAGLKAFVPKETADQINATLQGMLADGTLHGLGNLVADIAEIKARQITIEAILRHIAANGLPGNPPTVDAPRLALTEHRTDGQPGSGISAGGEPDDGRGVHFTAHNEVGRAAE